MDRQRGLTRCLSLCATNSIDCQVSLYHGLIIGVHQPERGCSTPQTSSVHNQQSSVILKDVLFRVRLTQTFQSR